MGCGSCLHPPRPRHVITRLRNSDQLRSALRTAGPVLPESSAPGPVYSRNQRLTEGVQVDRGDLIEAGGPAPLDRISRAFVGESIGPGVEVGHDPGEAHDSVVESGTIADQRAEPPLVWLRRIRTSGWRTLRSPTGAHRGLRSSRTWCVGMWCIRADRLRVMIGYGTSSIAATSDRCR